MKIVVDANVVISALIADSTTRELLLELDHEFFTPDLIHDEIDRHMEMIAEKAGLDRGEGAAVVERLFAYITVVPRRVNEMSIEAAETAIGSIDPDDILSLASALVLDATIWSDDADFQAQDRVEVYTTAALIEAVDWRRSGPPISRFW